MLKDILDEIDTLLAKNYKHVFDSLQIGSTESELELLKIKCFSGEQVPQDLETLYKWHNGQTGYYSLNQEDNRTLLSISEVIEAWKFMNDPMEEILEPWSKSWIPILDNGAGDYIVYESEGIQTGKLISYWHDDEERWVEFENLESWAQAVLKYTKDVN